MKRTYGKGRNASHLCTSERDPLIWWTNDSNHGSLFGFGQFDIDRSAFSSGCFHARSDSGRVDRSKKALYKVSENHPNNNFKICILVYYLKRKKNKLANYYYVRILPVSAGSTLIVSLAAMRSTWLFSSGWAKTDSPETLTVWNQIVKYLF